MRGRVQFPGEKLREHAHFEHTRVGSNEADMLGRVRPRADRATLTTRRPSPLGTPPLRRPPLSIPCGDGGTLAASGKGVRWRALALCGAARNGVSLAAA